MTDLDLGALDAWITGNPDADEDPDANALDDMDEARWLADEAKCAAQHTDADLIEMFAWILANMPNSPAVPIWRAEVVRRNLTQKE